MFNLYHSKLNMFNLYHIKFLKEKKVYLYMCMAALLGYKCLSQKPWTQKSLSEKSGHKNVLATSIKLMSVTI